MINEEKIEDYFEACATTVLKWINSCNTLEQLLVAREAFILFVKYRFEGHDKLLYYKKEKTLLEAIERQEIRLGLI